MKKLLSKLHSFLMILLLVSCAKEDAPQSVILDGADGGIISRFQIVTIDFGSTLIPNDQYAGTFNNQPITLSKIENNKLLFYVGEKTALGKRQLIIPSLNNTKIVYDVVDAVLKQTPEATLEPLLSSQKQYGNSLTTSPADAPYLENHNAITAYISKLSNEDKIKAAKFYKTNKTIIDPVYNTDYNSIQGKFSNKTQTDFNFPLYKSLVNRHILAVAVTIIGGTLAITPPYEPIETTLSVAITLAGIKKSSDFHNQIISDVFRVVEINLNGSFGLNNRIVAGEIKLVDNEQITTSFAVQGQTINNADSNFQKEFVQKFFATKSKLNAFIGNINTTITWLNTNIFFSNLKQISTLNVPTYSTSSSFQANSDLMQRFTFSVSHPNLLLETASLGNKGELKLKIKIVGNPSASSITSKLNYTYNDDFSSFSGSFPIIVSSGISVLQSLSFINKTNTNVCVGGGKEAVSVIYQHQTSFTGATPVGGTLYNRTLWDNQNDNVFEGVGGYMSFPILATNVTQQGANFIVTGNGNGYCWGLLSTQLKVEYYFVSAKGVESPHYFVPVGR